MKRVLFFGSLLLIGFRAYAESPTPLPSPAPCSNFSSSSALSSLKLSADPSVVEAWKVPARLDIVGYHLKDGGTREAYQQIRTAELFCQPKSVEGKTVILPSHRVLRMLGNPLTIPVNPMLSPLGNDFATREEEVTVFTLNYFSSFGALKVSMQKVVFNSLVRLQKDGRAHLITLSELDDPSLGRVRLSHNSYPYAYSASVQRYSTSGSNGPLSARWSERKSNLGYWVEGQRHSHNLGGQKIQVDGCSPLEYAKDQPYGGCFLNTDQKVTFTEASFSYGFIQSDIYQMNLGSNRTVYGPGARAIQPMLSLLPQTLMITHNGRSYEVNENGQTTSTESLWVCHAKMAAISAEAGKARADVEGMMSQITSKNGIYPSISLGSGPLLLIPREPTCY